MPSKYRAEHSIEAFVDSMPHSNVSNDEHPTQKLVKQDVMNSYCKFKVMDSDGLHKPISAASKNLVSGHQTVIPVDESFKENVSKRNSSKHTKYPKRTNLANRSDVLNKCSIRKLRRHFLTLFKTKINNTMSTRLKRVPFDKVYEAMKELLRDEYGDEDIDMSLCIFIIGITKLKAIENLNISSDIKSGVSLFSLC